MAYILQAFIVKTSDQNTLTNIYKNAIAVELGHELSLIPLTSKLFHEINQQVKSKQIGRFDSLTENMEIELLKHIENIKMAYVEADYFGGRGEQVAIMWEGKKRVHLSDAGKGEINKVLKMLGVMASKGCDEFDSVSLGRYKRTERWLEK